MVIQQSSARRALGALAFLSLAATAALADGPANQIDLANLTAGVDPLTRINGFDQDLGDRGVPVAAGGDIDGDGFEDFAVGYFLSDPLGRTDAGEVELIFGNGAIADNIDLTVNHPRVLRIIGSGNLNAREGAGSEIWMGEITGDNLYDLIICRQNYSINAGGQRLGAGSVAVIVGSPMLKTLAASNTTIDLASPPAGVTVFDIVGPHSNSRLGIWARVADVDGDGTDDLIAPADQETSHGDTHAGAAYVIRGGPHLNQNAQVDLANYGSTILAGNIARILPPSGSAHFHLGSTNQGGDLDGNGRAEVLLSAALNRSGAVVGPTGNGGSTTHATGGADPNGWAFIVWDDNFPAPPWSAGFTIDLTNPPGSQTIIRGGSNNDTFGEELLGGLDYDNDGNAEFFVGDLTGDGTGGSRPTSGVGYVFYDAAALKGLDFVVDNAAGQGLTVTTILGPSNGAIGADTVAHGDYNGDGIGDLLFGSPTDSPFGRSGAGSVQLIYGGQQWPAVIDTAPNAFPPATQVLVTEVLGVEGAGGGGSGDTLCYSASAGDIDGDGRQDLVVNEMRGDGLVGGTTDAGNLVIISGEFAEPNLEVLVIRLPGGAPDLLNPNGESVAVSIAEGAPGDLMVGSERLVYDAGSGTVTVPLTDNGGGNYTGTFPGFMCGTSVSWYIAADTVGGLTFTSPTGAPGESYASVAAVGETNLASHDMEAGAGWTSGMPGDDATTGIWERGDPNGTDAQPENDHTPSPGTDCWFTGQAAPGAGNGSNDVDGGTTTLLSPVFDLSGETNPSIAYWRWYSNSEGTNNDDVFRVDITDDGGTWVNVETLGPNGPDVVGGWIRHSFRVLDVPGMSLTNQVQMRFVASDLGQGSIVEAAIDDLSIDEVICDTGLGTPYCDVVPNSLGLEGMLTASGSNAAADNDVTLEATDLPPNQFGYFLVSPIQGFIQNVPGSVGNLCLGNPVGRYVQQIQNSGPAGAFSVQIDLTSTPMTPPVAVMPGETWNFQGWYRDFLVFQTSNFTNGYSILFQ
ncbi:MAG: hypothetical protein GY711_18535 [bacterium]|nr:hypothetical protein [bacterium]